MESTMVYLDALLHSLPIVVLIMSVAPCGRHSRKKEPISPSVLTTTTGTDSGKKSKARNSDPATKDKHPAKLTVRRTQSDSDDHPVKKAEASQQNIETAAEPTQTALSAEHKSAPENGGRTHTADTGCPCSAQVKTKTKSPTKSINMNSSLCTITLSKQSRKKEMPKASRPKDDKPIKLAEAVVAALERPCMLGKQQQCSREKRKLESVPGSPEKGRGFKGESVPGSLEKGRGFKGESVPGSLEKGRKVSSRLEVQLTPPSSIMDVKRSHNNFAKDATPKSNLQIPMRSGNKPASSKKDNLLNIRDLDLERTQETVPTPT